MRSISYWNWLLTQINVSTDLAKKPACPETKQNARTRQQLIQNTDVSVYYRAIKLVTQDLATTASTWKTALNFGSCNHSQQYRWCKSCLRRRINQYSITLCDLECLSCFFLKD